MSATAAEPHNAQPATNTLSLQLALRDGFLKVEAGKTQLQLTPQFLALSYQPSNSVWTEIVTWLDRSFEKEGRVIDFAVVSNKNPRLVKAVAGAAPEFDRRVADLAHLTTNWLAASGQFFRFQKDYRDKADLNLFQMVERHVIQRFSDAYNRNSPLIMVTSSGDDSINMGKLLLRLRNPVTPAYASWSNVDFRINASEWMRAGVKPQDLEPLLRGQIGRLWWPDTFHRELDDYFVRMGYDVATDASAGVGLNVNWRTGHIGEVGGRPWNFSPGVIVQGSPHLAHIQVALDTNHVSTVLRLLYMVLPHEDYSQLLQDWHPYLTQFKLPVQQTNADHTVVAQYGTKISLLEPPGNHLVIAQWFVNRLELQDRLRALLTLGYSATLLGAETQHKTNKLADLYISPSASKGSASSSKSSTNSPPVVSESDDESRFDPVHGNTNFTSVLPLTRGTNVAQRAADPLPRAVADQSPRRKATEPDFRYTLEAGLTVASKEDPRVWAGYTQAGVTTNDAVAAQVGYQDQALGNLNYTRDFLAFDSLKRRWTASVSGFSDYNPNRLFMGTNATERRSGGTFSSQFELFRNWHAHWLRLELSGGWRQVRDQLQGSPATNNPISDGDLGLLYFWRRDGTKYSPNILLEPHVRVGWADQTSAWFAQPGLRGGTHWLLPSFFELDCRADFQWASGQTPTSELPSFGGDDSVRGYRADAGIGRTAWSIQNELWIPVRYNFGWSNGVDRFVRRSILLATFVDVGGVYQTQDSFSGFKAGAGCGLRVIWQDNLAFRLDFGQALTGTDNGRGGSFVYFGITTRRPLFE